MILCYGVLLKILVLCKAANEKQKNINGTLLMSVNNTYDVRTDDHLASTLIRCKKNLAEDVTNKKILRKIEQDDLIKYFENDVRPLINPEKEHIVLRALQNIISSSDFNSRRVGKLGRKQILKEENLATFLANVFLYTLAVPNKCKDGETFVRSLNGEMLSILADNTVENSNYVQTSEPPISTEQLPLPLLTNGRCLSCGKSLIQQDKAPRCLIWVGERNECSLCSHSLLPMDKLWDLDVEIQLAASQIDHGLEIFIISEPSGATLDVLYDAVHPFQNGIRIGVLEIVQDLVPMIADRATKLLHGFQPCVHHPAAELFQTLLRLVSMDGLLVDFLQFDAHGTGTRCL